MPDGLEAKTLFLDNLAYVERAAIRICSQSGVQGDAVDDFVSHVTLKLMENDYAVLRQFRSTSSITTYLSTVVVRQFVEFQRQLGGRWRSSAAATRIGPPAPELERLVYRQGYTLSQAAQKLRSSGRSELSDLELARMLAQLPVRDPLRPAQTSSELTLDGLVAADRADEQIRADEAEVRRDHLVAAMRAALESFSPEDRTILWMRFAERSSVPDIARAIEKASKPLYRRVDQLRERLRDALEQRGVRPEDVSGLMEDGERE